MPTLADFQTNSGPFSRALGRILSEGRFTAAEMAEICDCSDRHIQRVAAGQGHLSDDKATRLQRWLCDNDEIRLSQVSVCASFVLVPRVEGSADGCVQSEIVRLVKAAALCDDGMSERDPARMDEAIRLVEAALADLRAERNTLT